MMIARRLLLICLITTAIDCLTAVSAGAQQTAERHFANDVWPLLSERCLACHGNDQADVRGGLDLTSDRSALLGGDSGEAAWRPGVPEQSPLFLALLRDHASWSAMPPKESDAFSRDEIETVRQWISDGAIWLDAEGRAAHLDDQLGSDSQRVATSGGQDASWSNRVYEKEKLWAYRPIQPVDPPGGGHPIDAFLEKRLSARGLATAPQAEPRAFIRRITFDVTGLPPSPAEIERFLADWREDPRQASMRLTERLLSSPHYGERQAQHWLDVTRYADTSGGSNDYERPAVWRYRDYVIRSFNEDKPYDQFVLEQIAGDLLSREDPETSVAAGFLRMGAWEATKMNPAAVVRQQFLDDIVNHVGETFLAQPLRCAKCHDHKFDPIPTRDYYRIMAVFGDTHPAEVDTPFLPEETTAGAATEQRRVEREVKRINEQLDALAKKNFDAGVSWLQHHGVEASQLTLKTGGQFSVFGTQFGSIAEGQRPPKNVGLSTDEITLAAVLTKRRGYLERSLVRFEPVAYTVYSGPPNDYNSHQIRNPRPDSTSWENSPIRILQGGALETPGDDVSAGALSCLKSLASYSDDLTLGSSRGDGGASTPPRLAFARWVAHAQNPLTARVIVNRVWQQHFSGVGLVATPNNFGYTGSRPSHPELLDFLADWFVRGGWSIKKLHRLILSSDAYRRSARHPDPQRRLELDPEGRLLAVFPARRLHAEEIRDAMLVSTGELNRQVGGPPAFPEISLEAALQPRYVQSSVAPAYQPSPLPKMRHRRSIYAFRLRGLADPFLQVFDRPSADVSCDRRSATTVTPQVFSLFNGQQRHDRALALAHRLQQQADSAEQMIRLAYRLLYGREADEGEVARALGFVKQQTAVHRASNPERVEPPTSVRRSMVFEMTGVPSEWEEPLDIYAGSFVPDLKPWDVRPETRAVAALTLVLFNSNEFLYLE